MNDIESKDEWERNLNATNEEGQARNILDGPSDDKQLPKRRQSKVRWDLMNNVRISTQH